MSDNEHLTEIAELKQRNTDLQKQLDEISVSKYEEKIDELSKSVANLNEEIETRDKTIESSKAEITTLKGEIEELNQALVTANEHYEKMEKEKKKKERKDKMKGAGMPDDEAEAKYEVVDSMTDAQFDLFVEAVKAAQPEEVVETVEASEVVDSNSDESEVGSHSVASSDDDSEISVARAGLQSWVSEQIVKLNKLGE